MLSIKTDEAETNYFADSNCIQQLSVIKQSNSSQARRFPRD